MRINLWLLGYSLGERPLIHTMYMKRVLCLGGRSTLFETDVW